MSGIVGVWNLDGRPVDGTLLDRMGRAVSHRGPDGPGRWAEGSAGLACWHLWVTPEEVNERQPLVGPSGSRLVLDGRLDDRDELLGALGRSRNDSDAALALATFERWGDGFAERLNGDFALGVYDPRSHRMLLARDSIGARPLYYHHQPGRLFAFASEVKALLAVPGLAAVPDLDGLADCLLLGERPLDRQDVTCFAGISALPPAHVAVVTPDRVVVRRYWDFDVHASLRLSSFNEYVEAFGERFAQAVRRRSRSAWPVAVSVSGGLDSSSVLSQMEIDRRNGVANNPGAVGVSYTGPDGSDADEQRYLGDLEREYGLSIARIPIEPLRGLVRGAWDQVRAVEMPYMDYMWGVTEVLNQRMKAAGARVVLSGQWGDQVLFSSAYLVDLFNRFRWGTIWRHTREYGRWFGLERAGVWRGRFLLDVVRHHTPRALVPPLKWIRRRLSRGSRPKPWLSADFLERGRRFANRPAVVGNGFHSAQAQAVYLEARSKYHVHCMEWNNKITACFGLDAAFPFLDRELLAFLMAAPGEMQARGGVPRAFLREAMKGVLPEPVRTRTWKADFTEEMNSGVAGDMDHIARILKGESYAARVGILNPERVGPEVARLAAGLGGPDALDGWELADLFGLETWVRVFLSGEDKDQATAVGRTA